MPDGSTGNGFMRADQPTMQSVFDFIEQDPRLAAQRRRNLLSALRGLGKLAGKPLSHLPPHPRFYRTLFDNLHTEHCGLTESRIRNIKSDVMFALKHTGCIQGTHTYMAPFSEPWQALWDAAAPAGALRRYLSRFLHYCSANGIDPEDVDDGVSERFLQALVEESFIRNPIKTHRDLCKLWNRAVDTVPGWPQVRLTVPRYKKTYTLALEAYPQALRDEIQALVDWWSGRDILDDTAPAKPLAPRTVKSRLYRLRQVLAALVHGGHAIDDIVSLSMIVEIRAAKSALRYHLDRNGGQTSTQIHGLAVLLKTIAKHWVRVDETHYAALQALCKRVEPNNEGLTPKNRDRLRQFDDSRNVALLLGYPKRIVKNVRQRDRGRRQEAIDVQIALAVEILLMAPIRAANLVAIEIDRHIVRSRGRAGVVHLVIPGSEVKNGEPLEFELPRETVDLLDLYLEVYHPRLTQSGSVWLFPGAEDGPKGRELLGDQIARRVFKATGLRVNLHLFRHIAAKLYLDRNPGGYEVVRRLLGHKSMDTTVRFYAGLETSAAGKHFDSEILKLRSSLTDKAA